VTRDLLWEALVAAFGYTPVTRSERGKWNKACRELREAGVDPDEVRPRMLAYRARWPQINCNPMALVAHWGELAPKARVEVEASVRRFASLRTGWRLPELIDDAVYCFRNDAHERDVRVWVTQAWRAAQEEAS
jgi:hypothetical protein